MHTAGTVVWALLPLLLPGLGAPLACAVGVARRPSAATVVPLVVYPAALVGFFACVYAVAPGEDRPWWSGLLGMTALLAATGGAAAHLLVIRRYVWAPFEARAAVPRAPKPVPRGAHGSDWVAPALDRAARLRDDARRLAEADPALAKRSGVGRPDRPRALDDGGLVDLNHAPVEVLRDLPGFNEATARQVRERVERLGPFQSLDEVIVEVGIAPGFEKHLREYALLMP